MSLTNLRSSQTLTNAALAGSLAALIVWFGPPGTDFAAHVFQLARLPPARLRALDELLVRGPLHVRRLQPPLLPARGAGRDPAARGAQRRRVGRRVHARHPAGLGRVDRLGDPLLRRRRRRLGRLGRLPVRPRARASRSPRSSRSRAGSSSLFGLLAALTLAASPLAFLFLLLVLAAAAVSRSRREIAKPAAIAAVDLRASALLALAPLPRPRRAIPFSIARARSRRSSSARSASASPGASSARGSCTRSSSAYGGRLPRSPT